MASSAAKKVSSVKLPIQLFGLNARYANSLYLAAAKANSLKEVEKDLAELSGMMQSTPKFVSYLHNPIVKRLEKKADLEKISKGMNNVTRGFLGILAENGRAGELSKIIATFTRLMDAERGIVNATVTSADELTPEQIKTVESQIKSTFLKPGQSLRLTTNVDYDILGGLQVQVGDKFIDLSVASQINAVTKALSSN